MDPVIQNENGESDVKEPENPVEIIEESNPKTFKNAFLAKKRLQAFSAQKQNALPLAASLVKNKSKTSFTVDKIFNEKSESPDISRKTQKKAEYPMDKAKALIEEIEMLKKVELLQSIPLTSEERLLSLSTRRSRSRSQSSERDFIFRKREKKPRNYRRSDPNRKSLSPTITKAKDKTYEKKPKYPKNWDEFIKDKWTFEKITKPFYTSGRKANPSNDIFKQLLFEAPAETIKPFYYKCEKGEEISVPYQFMRFTQAKPQVGFSVNLKNIKEQNLSRAQILKVLPKKHKVVLEKFLSKNTKAKFRATEPMGQRNWYHKNWKENDAKIHETSIGLSFLQTYSDDDEEDEFIQDLNQSVEIDESKKEKIRKRLDIIDLKKFTPFDDLKIRAEGEATCFQEGEIIIGGDGEIRTPELIKNNEDIVVLKEVDVKIPDVRKKEDEILETPKKDEKRHRKRDRESRSPGTSSRVEKPNKMKEIEDKVIRNKDKRKNTPENLDYEDKILEKDMRGVNIHKKNEKNPKQQENLEDTPRRTEEEVKPHDITTETRKKSSKSDKKTIKDVPIAKIEEIVALPPIPHEEALNKEETSWTPERITHDPDESNCENKIKNDKPVKDVVTKIDKNYDRIEEMQKAREIYSQDEWDETPNNSDSDHVDSKKNKKHKKKVNHDSDSSSSSDTSTSKKKKKKEKKKKQKDKIEKEKKKNKKLKQQKMKLKEKKRKKRKERDREKKILKKLKKQIEHNLEMVEMEELEIINKVEDKDINQIPIVVKTEKEDDYERIPRPPGDLRNLLDKKIGKLKKDEKSSPKRHIFNEEKLVDKNEQLKEIKKEKISTNKVLNESSIEQLELIKQLVPMEKNTDKKSEIIVSKVEIKHKIKEKSKDESVCTNTPDTDEYHSNWESDDAILPPKKFDRSWGSDEEMFDRSFAKKTALDIPFGESHMFEIPLNIKKFSRRDSEKKQSKKRSRTRSPERFDIDNEIKLLEKERKNLSKERLQLEIEKLRIQELERKNSMDEMALISEIPLNLNEEELKKRKDKKGSRWDLREDHVDSSTSKDKKEIEDNVEKEIENVQILENQPEISNSPEITSTKSPIPNVLENAYEEFMKAVCAVDEESKDLTFISSTENEAVESPIKHKENEELTKIEENTLLSTTDPKVLQEILLPGEIPIVEIQIPAPVPVPSPKIDILPNLPPIVVVNVQTAPPIPSEPIVEQNFPEETEEIEDFQSKKTFSFSTLVLPSKKNLLEKSNWKLDEESEDETLPGLSKMYEDTKSENEDFVHEKTPTKNVHIKTVKKDEMSQEKPIKRKRSPVETSKDKRRKDDDDRSRDERHRDDKRRDRGRRSGSAAKTSPRRRRLASPTRRRSPSRYNRSPNRRQEASRRRSRSPHRRRRSYSPAARQNSRRRSPSPQRHFHHHSRRSKSPGHHSPMDGLKRSVADSTISDDLLPQPYMVECSNSPLNTVNRRARLTLSPKRPSLDERINQVLGIESTSWKNTETAPDYSHEHENLMYTNYHQEASFTCGTSKVLQVGNILQVVPSEEPLPPTPIQPPPTTKILQVGNMLQIVPSDMEVTLPPPPPPPVENSSLHDDSYVMPLTTTPPAYLPKQPPLNVHEKQSAEALLLAKNAERLAERAKKRREKEERKLEKERKRKERDKKRKMRLKVSTEEMIKRALELEGFLDNDNDVSLIVPEIISDTPGVDPSKSILSTTTKYSDGNKTDKRKSVQFADGIRPGEGTSPSGGEELSSPPPQTEETTKIKKYKKLDVAKKKKRKIKVKVIKRRLPSPDSDEEYENLPPPSPPPGSPPPHVFPPRVKVHTINNVPQHYLPTYGVTPAPQQQPVINQPPHLLGYQTTPPPTVYRPPPTAHVMGQHYVRSSLPPPTQIHHQTYGF